jgi:serine/threonine-protein kinase
VEAAPDLRPLAAGTMLDDKYRIERLLAVGGMGAVYEGTHTKLRKRVAIKVLNPQLASKSMLDRFHREAITASQIGHEGIAQVTDLGTAASGEAFIVMELLEGEPLSARLLNAKPKQMPIEVACELGCAILSPLAAAHAAGVVHRDLKPDNVFLVRQSRGEMVKLLDFGISRASGLEQEFRLTTTGLVLGTPYYMSPEQARGETQAIGPAADIYSFGVIMYEMLVGEVPIKADNYNQLMYRVMNGDFARPREKRPDLPPQLEEIVVRAMALDPSARPPSAAALEQALLAFCRPTFRDHMIERISAVGFKSSSPLLPTPHANASVAPTAIEKKPMSKLPLLLAGFAAVGIAVAVLVAKLGTSETKPETKQAPVVETKAEISTAPVETKPVEPPPPPPVEPPPPTVEPANITIRFEVEPSNAAIEIDGNPVNGTTLDVPKDGKRHGIVITASGYQLYKEDVVFDENQKLVIKLDKAGAKPTKRTRPVKSSKPDRIDPNSPYTQ